MASYNVFLDLVGSPSVASVPYSDDHRSHFGGDISETQPMITGFGYIFLTAPSLVSAKMGDKKIFTALAQQFDPPGAKISSIEYEGRNGGKWYVPGKSEMTSNTFQVKFWELADTPIYRAMAYWVSLMRNHHFAYMTEIAWEQKLYKGRLMYCTCTPDLKVRYAQVYPGVFPLDPKGDKFTWDNTAQDKVELEIEFQFDHFPFTGPDVINSAQSLIDNIKSSSLDPWMETEKTNYMQTGIDMAGRQ